jgi:hypothetical protein
MRKALVILIVLFGVFLAIGCAGQKSGAPNETGTPEKAVTEVQVVTGVEAVTPVQEVVVETAVIKETPVTEVTPAMGVTPATAVVNVTGKENVTQPIVIVKKTKHEENITRIQTTTTPSRNTGTIGGEGGVIHVTPNTGK